MGEPTKVVHIVEDLRTGGLEKVVRHIVVSLDRARFDPAVWCLARGGDIAEQLAAQGVRVEIGAMGKRPSPAFLLGLAGRLRGARAGVVHCHGYTASTAGRAAALLARTPRVFAHIHTQGFWLEARQRRIERVLAAFSTMILCVSESVREFVVREEGIPREKTTVIYNGIPDPPLPERESARRQLGIPEDARVLGCVASLEPHKGHAVLIEALRLARTGLRDIVLLLVGDGSLRDELQRRARDADIQAVFAGRLENVGPALAAMDAFALLSLEREGLSLALLEAMAASKPVIASRVGGLPEVVEDGVNGLLCGAGDAPGASRCILRILGDTGGGRSMGEAGRRKFLERFTLGRMVSAIERLYDA
ncbi:MAG TPA: glycosyltransferase [Candidatus Methylomirabilis sp.]|nr:glycosyltransferase [Candidatus Methylomirabilis sp.]